MSTTIIVENNESTFLDWTLRREEFKSRGAIIYVLIVLPTGKNNLFQLNRSSKGYFSGKTSCGS